MNFEGADLFFLSRDGHAVRIHCTLSRDELITEKVIYDDQGIILGTARTRSAGPRKELLRRVFDLLSGTGPL